jgi:DNA-binding protein YbaB
MFNQLKMIKQARDLQKKLKEIEISDEYKGIKIKINGKQEILSIELPDDLLQDKSDLENKLKDAFNNVVSKSQREIAMKMQGDLGGLLGM